MKNFELKIGDCMLEEQVKIKAKEHGISELELIKQYIKKGLENDTMTNNSKTMTREERIRIFKEDVEEDKQKGTYVKQGNFEDLIEKLKIRSNGEW